MISAYCILKQNLDRENDQIYSTTFILFALNTIFFLAKLVVVSGIKYIDLVETFVPDLVFKTIVLHVMICHHHPGLNPINLSWPSHLLSYITQIDIKGTWTRF